MKKYKKVRMSCVAIDNSIPYDFHEFAEKAIQVDKYFSSPEAKVSGKYTELRDKFRKLQEYCIYFKNVFESIRFGAAFDGERHSFDLRQMRIFIFVFLENLLRVIRNTKSYSAKVPYLSSEEVLLLTEFIELFSRKNDILAKIVSQSEEFDFEKSNLLYRIGPHKLKNPVHIIIEPDEDEWFLSCFETPQIFGSGKRNDKNVV